MPMTAAQFTSLKTKADAEWSRRRYYGSMASYAGKAYTPRTPSAGTPMYATQGNLVMTPFTIMKTHGNLATSSPGTPIQSNFDYATVNNWLTTLAGRPATSSTNDCNSSCSGLCVSQCSTACKGCSGCTSCSGTCSGGCTSCTSCSGCSGCSGTCTGSCTSCRGCTGCSSCSGTCTSCTGCTSCSSCSGTCTSCTGCSGCSSCSGTCTSCSGCSGGCTSCTSCSGCSGCSSCSGSCSGTCSGCSGSCSGCRGCRGCGSDCTGGCSASCSGGAKKGCSGCGGCNSCSGCAGCSGCRGASIRIPPMPHFDEITGEKGEEIEMKHYTIQTSQETNDYLQRLDYDIETRLLVIDKLFSMHKDDGDASLFESSAWKKYYSELEEAKVEFELAKLKLQTELSAEVDRIEGRQGVRFNWSVNSYLVPEAQIVVLED